MRIELTTSAIILLLAAHTALAGPAEDQYAVAAGHYSRGRWPLAVQEFETFLKQYPQHEQAVLARFFLGEAQVQQGQYAAARANFDAFHQARPNHNLAPQALFRRGEAAYMLGDVQAARRLLTEFRQQHAQHPLNAYAMPYLGDSLLTVETAGEAQRIYTEALRNYGDSPLADQCRFGLGRALQLQKRYSDAATFYNFVAAKADSPLADDAVLQLGHMQYQQGQFPAAVTTLEGFKQKYQQSDLMPFASYWQGLAHLAQGDAARAVATLAQAAGVSPEHPLAAAARFHLGEAQRRTGQLDAAAQQLASVTADFANTPWADDAARSAVRIALERGDHDTLESLAENFSATYTDSPLRFEVQRTLARSRLQREKFAEAKEVLKPLVVELDREATSLGPAGAGEGAERTSHADLKASARYLLALAEVATEQHQQALATLQPLEPNEKDEPQWTAGLYAVKASALMGLQQYEAAIAPLEGYLRLSPEGSDAAKSRAQLAVALAETGKLKEAKQAYQQFAAAGPQSDHLLETTHYLAETALAAGDRSWARELFTVLADEKQPAEYRAMGLSGKAWAELDSDEPETSVKTFGDFLAAFPDSPQAPAAAMARGKALQQLERPGEALSMYQLVIDKYSNSKQLPDALLAAAGAQEAQGNLEESAALLERLVKEFPQREELDGALYRWAWLLNDLKQADDSQAVFSRLHAEFPDSQYWADATYRLAESAAAAGNFERAEQLTAAILKSKATGQVLAHALYLRGQAFAREEKWDKVAQPMQQLIAEHPRSPLKTAARYWVAESDYRQGQYEKAAERFAVLARDTEGREESWLAMIPLRRAQLLAQEKKWAAALAIASKIAETYPNFSQQYEADYLLGRCLASQAKFSDAREAYQRAIESKAGGRTETAAMAQWMTGETYFHQKDYDNAIRAYSRVELLYDFPRWQAAALLQAGKCYELQSQWDEAAQRYRQVVEQFPETTFKEEASRRLKAAEQKATTARRP